jgi:intergrase/recombinase
MRLLDMVSTSGEWYFPVDWHKIIEVVETAATEVGVQRLIPTKQGRMRKEIHPHSLRDYYKSRMTEAKVPEHVSQFMMGHKPRHGGAYDHAAYKEENLLKAYVQAERFLSIE